MIEQSDGVDLIRKVGPELPSAIDPDFNAKFDETTHIAYLQEHLKTDYMPANQALGIVDLVKRHWRVINPDCVRFPIIRYECDIDTGNTAPVTYGNVNY